MLLSAEASMLQSVLRLTADLSEIDEKDVPKVHLHATNESALKGSGVDMDLLKSFAHETETDKASGARAVPQSKKGGLGGAVKETTELASKDDMTSRKEL